MPEHSQPFALAVADLMDDHSRQPRRESIRLVREKYGDVADISPENVPSTGVQRGLLAVEFESGDGHHYRGCAEVERIANRERWRLAELVSGRIRQSNKAWVELGGSPNRWLALVVNRADARTVRLVDARGAAMEDTAENGIALFLWDRAWFALRTSTVELLDKNGNTTVSEPYNRKPWERAAPA